MKSSGADKDVDQAFKQAATADAKVDMPLAGMFWGDRYGRPTGPWGHSWSLATHKEDLSPEGLKKRAEAVRAKGG